MFLSERHMKHICTQNREEPITNYDALRGDIVELPYSDEGFITLYSDEREDYVQTALENPEDDENSPYLVEARVYRSADDWTHYRTTFASAAEVLPAFEAYYHDRPYDYSDWQDVSDEFA